MALVKYNNNSISVITAASSLPTGAMTLIKSQTASSSATISFVDGTSDVVLDNTYPIYLFKFINIHAATQDKVFQFNMSADTGSNYNVTKTTTAFYAYNPEGGGSAALGYTNGSDVAQSTGFAQIANDATSTDNDAGMSGEVWLFSPSSTTYVKHFMSRSSYFDYTNLAYDRHIAGYGNTTSAVDAIQFKFSSGNIDAGIIKLYGIKDS
jgi:hypothetical protein